MSASSEPGATASRGVAVIHDPLRAQAEADVILPAGVDLHARPAAEFVRTAMRFKARIVISLGEREADAKSLLAVLGLGAKGGSSLSLRADGGDALPAVEALRGCVCGLN